MALTETQDYKIEINEGKSIGVRRADIVLRDGVEIARSFHRSVFMPGEDVSDQPQEVQEVAATVWTDEVVAEYRATLETEDGGAEPAVAAMSAKKK